MKTLTQVLLVAASTYAIATAQPKTALQGGFVESADVLVYMDMAKMNDSAFSKAMEAQMPAEEKAKQEAQQKAFTEATGLTEEDFGAMVFSADLAGIDFQAAEPPDISKLPLSACLELKKSVTLDQINAAIDAMKEEQGTEFKVEKTTIDGIELLNLMAPEGEETLKNVYVTTSKNGKAVLAAVSVDALKDSLGRIAAGKVAPPTKDMATAMNSMGDNPFRMALVLTEQARASLKDGVQKAAAQGGMAAILMPFAEIKSVLISANTQENMDLAISLDVGNENNAVEASGWLHMMMVGMGQQLAPQAMEIGQRLKIGTDKSVVSMNLTLTAEDLEGAKWPR